MGAGMPCPVYNGLFGKQLFNRAFMVYLRQLDCWRRQGHLIDAWRARAVCARVDCAKADMNDSRSNMFQQWGLSRLGVIALASAEMGREQLVSDMAREVREAEEAGWPEDKEECVEERAVVDGAGVPAEFEVVARDVQYEKG